MYNNTRCVYCRGQYKTTSTVGLLRREMMGSVVEPLFLMFNLKTNKIMNKFECSECGTRYSSPETTPPPGIKWSDGHVCTPKPVNK
jgi:hypothetical protein